MITECQDDVQRVRGFYRGQKYIEFRHFLHLTWSIPLGLVILYSHVLFYHLCFQSAEAEIRSPPKARQENIKFRKWEKPGFGFAQNGQQSFTDLVKDSPFPSKPKEVAGQAVKKPNYSDTNLNKSDNKYEKEHVPEKEKELDIKSGGYCM